MENVLIIPPPMAPAAIAQPPLTPTMETINQMSVQGRAQLITSYDALQPWHPILMPVTSHRPFMSLSVRYVNCPLR